MTVEVDDILQVTPRFLYAPSNMQNDYFVKMVGPAGVPDDVFDTATAVWLEVCYTNLLAKQTQGLGYNDILIRNVTQDTPTRFEPWPTLTAGLSGGDTLPLQVAGLVSFPTTYTKSQVRKYIPGLMEIDSLTGGDLSATLVAALVDYAIDVLAGYLAAGNDVEVGAWNDLLQRFAPIVASSVSGIFRTQRRRVKGVGQ